MNSNDKLTGLLLFDDFIRVASEKLLSHEPDENGTFVLVSTDFSKFKYINRVYGYSKGDDLIIDLATIFLANEECLISCRPYSDHVVGLFYINKNLLDHYTERLKTLQEEFVALHKADFPKASIHINIGIYIISDHKEPITSCIDKANIARRSVKGNYSVPYALYTKKLQDRKEAESKLIPIFEKALENRSILVYLQPKVNVETGKVNGAEALTRLLDDDGKIVPPDMFIPVLEDSGKVLDLDWYVMKYVFAKIKEWLNAGKEVVPISVNLSKLHFYHDTLVTDILAEFDKYDISPEYVEFEVTESVFIEESGLIIDKISQLRSHGFKVSVDDFGAGYSSLNLIGILPVDIIKLDKGFIKSSLDNKKCRDIIKGLIQILNEIEMDIVCEGIETHEEERTVYEFGCNTVQGFLYDKPIPVEDFEKKYM